MHIPEPKKTATGYRIQLRLGGQSIPVMASTARECRRRAGLIKAQWFADEHAVHSTGSLTLETAMERYIDEYSAVLSPSTERGYRIYQRNRFKAYRGMRLDAIPWQRMIDDELKTCSEKTVKNAWGLVHASLKLAGYPIPAVKLAAAPVREIAFLQPDEILAFCRELRGRSYEIPALLALNGLRYSEIKGLTWDCIDAKRGTVRVRGALVRSSSGPVRREANKNDTSTREVPILIPQLSAALEAARQPSGPLPVPTEQNLLDDVRRTCSRAGVTEVTTHGLRHSFASLGYYLKIPERQLMSWGGWKNYHVMHKIYIRMAAIAEQESKNAVQDFFSKCL